MPNHKRFPLFSPAFALCLAAAAGCTAPLGAQTVRFDTTLGGMDVVLTPSVTPLTVANFMTYVNSGAYNNTIIHRSLNAVNQISNVFYLIQGGGYTLGPANLPVLIPQNPPVVNEFKTSNTRGTLAMAQSGGDINSAADQWFFNASDNSGSLDSQSFTVFGNIANDAGLAVMDNINNLPTYAYNAGTEADFANLPLRNYSSGLIRPANFIFVNSISPITPAASAAGVQDAASAASTSAGISPGEILTLYGTELGPTQLTTLKLDSAGANVTNTLEGTQVLFNGTPGAMIFTSTGQIAVVVPYEIAGQSTVSVTVSYLGLKTNPMTLNVVAATPALFTLSENGQGDAAIVRYKDGSIVNASNPAAAGDILELYGEGYGVASPALADGAVVGATLPRPVAKTVVLIDGTPVTPLYAGAASGDVNGVLQVNFTPPQGLAAGTHTLQIQVGSAVSQTGVTLVTR